MILHFFWFVDEATAKAALPQFTVDGNWRTDFVDPGVSVVDDSGALKPGFFLNANLSALDASLPGLTGAGYGPANDFTLVYGVQPVTPQRVFA